MISRFLWLWLIKHKISLLLPLIDPVLSDLARSENAQQGLYYVHALGTAGFTGL